MTRISLICFSIVLAFGNLGCNRPSNEKSNPFIGIWEGTYSDDSTVTFGGGPLGITTGVQSVTVRAEFDRFGKGKITRISKGILEGNNIRVGEVRWGVERSGGKYILWWDRKTGDYGPGIEKLTVELVTKTSIVGTNEQGLRWFLNRISD
jgi:hypothetical protein